MKEAGMGSVNDAISVALVDVLKSKGVDAVEVISWEDTMASTGYCDTCYYEYAAVEINYVASNGESGWYEYLGSFAELIREF